MAKTTQVAKTEKLVIAVPQTTADVPATIEALKKQLAALKGNEDTKVSLDISYNGTNIKNVTKVSELLEISASVQARNKAYNEEVVRYKLEGKIKPFQVSEKTAEEWVKIIDKAVFELTNKTQIKNLEDAIKELSQHVDAETKLKNTLANIVEKATTLIS